HLMHEWAVDVPTEVIHEEYDHFMSWHTAYEEELAACDADDAELRLQRLLLCLEGDGGGLRLPEHIVLAGMREFSPRQQRLLTALEGQGCCIHLLDHSASPAREISRHAAADRGAEWRAAVAWARRKLDSGTGRYAIVAMSLQQDAAFARRVLQTDLSGHGFNMSVGRPLAEWPLVRAALGWLRLLTSSAPYPVDLAGGALLAGHCAGHRQEAGLRARIDADWRWREYDRLNQETWWRSLRHCPQLHEAWDQAQAILHDAREASSLHQWANLLPEVLRALGFPGDGTLNSAAYQTLQAFQELWRKLAALAPA